MYLRRRHLVLDLSHWNCLYLSFYHHLNRIKHNEVGIQLFKSVHYYRIWISSKSMKHQNLSQKTTSLPWTGIGRCSLKRQIEIYLSLGTMPSVKKHVDIEIYWLSRKRFSNELKLCPRLVYAWSVFTNLHMKESCRYNGKRVFIQFTTAVF